MNLADFNIKRDTVQSGKVAKFLGEILDLMTGVSLILNPSSEAFTDALIQQRRCQQDRAKEHAVVGAIEPWDIEQSVLGEAENDGAKHNAPHRPEATGQNGAANHGGCNRFKLFQISLGGIRRIRVKHLGRRKNGGGKGCEHKQADFYTVCRHSVCLLQRPDYHR